MRNKILSILVIMVLVMCLTMQIVNATSLTVTMKPSSSSVKEAAEFTVKVSVSNLDVGDNGINSLTGTLKYDEEVFEKIDESSVEGLNKWSASFDEESGKVELKKNTFVKTSQDVFQIVFKAKSGVVGKSGSISFSDVKASNSEENISASDISVSISIVENDGTSTSENTSANNTENKTVSIVAGTNSNNTNTNNTSSNNTTNNVTNNTSNNNTSNNNTSNNVTNNSSNYTNTTSKEDMPKTGVSDTLFTLMLVMIAVSLVFYIKFEKINKEFK